MKRKRSRLLAASTILLCTGTWGYAQSPQGLPWRAEFNGGEYGNGRADTPFRGVNGVTPRTHDPFETGEESDSIVPPAPQPSNRPPSGSVSLRSLKHPPKGKAMDLFLKAQGYSEKGDTAHAAEALERAIKISPDFADAHINLGAQYLRMHKWEEGIEELTKAGEIAGPNAMALSNLAFAQMYLHRYDDALGNLKQSLSLAPRAPQTNYLMGMLLAMKPQTRSQALPHLEVAARTLPVAQPLLESVRAWVAQKNAENAN